MYSIECIIAEAHIHSSLYRAPMSTNIWRSQALSNQSGDTERGRDCRTHPKVASWTEGSLAQENGREMTSPYDQGSLVMVVHQSSKC